MKLHHLGILIAFGANIIISGCANSELDSNFESVQSDLQISFIPAIDDSISSRGQETTAANLGTFAVSATVYDSLGNRRLYFAHEQYRYLGLDRLEYRTVSGQVHYWLSQSDEYNFYAYTPSQYIYFEPGVVDKFIYTTPKNVLKHPDIVVATCIAAQYGQPVPLEFTHPLAEISIYEGAVTRYGTIKSITFSGIVDHGEYNMLTGEWLMLQSDTDSFTWDCNVVATSATDLSGEYFKFFFVPQQLGSKAAITIVFENAYGIEEVHYVPLTGTWHGGHRYRYVVNL